MRNWCDTCNGRGYINHPIWQWLTKGVSEMCPTCIGFGEGTMVQPPPPKPNLPPGPPPPPKPDRQK